MRKLPLVGGVSPLYGKPKETLKINKSIMRSNFEKIKICIVSPDYWLSIDTKMKLKAWLGLELAVVNDLKVLCLEYTDEPFEPFLEEN